MSNKPSWLVEFVEFLFLRATNAALVMANMPLKACTCTDFDLRRYFRTLFFQEYTRKLCYRHKGMKILTE